MIINALLDVVVSLLGWIISVRPTWAPTIPSIDYFLSFIRTWDHLLPISEVLNCAGITMSLVAVFVGMKWGVKVVDWIADVIP